MTKQEFSKIGMAVKTYYPSANMLPNEQAFELWFHQLEDLPYDLAHLALDRWVALNKWPPTIADIRASAQEIKDGERRSWGDGWEDVMNAIGRFGMYRADEALESFDEITKEAVKRIGFVNICTSENITADRANFRVIYETLERRKKESDLIPRFMKELVMSIGKEDVKGIEEKRGEADG